VVCGCLAGGAVQLVSALAGEGVGPGCASGHGYRRPWLPINRCAPELHPLTVRSAPRDTDAEAMTERAFPGSVARSQPDTPSVGSQSSDADVEAVTKTGPVTKVGSSGRRRPAAWPAICSVLTVMAYLVWIWLKPGGEFGATIGGGVIATATPLIAGISCVRAGLRTAGSDRWGWCLLGAAMWSWVLGNVGWLTYTVLSPAGPPFPAATDIFFIALIPLALAGAAALGGLGRGGIGALLDGLVITGSLLFVSWVTVLGPLFQAGGQDAVFSFFILAGPIGDIAMASMVFILLARADRQRRPVLALVGCGMLALAVADSGFSYMIQQGAYSSGNLAMVGWIIGFLLIGAGARRRSHVSTVAPAAGDSPLWLALPYVPLGVALVTSVATYAARGALGPFLYFLSTVLVLLVIVRQLIALRDNVLLTRSLRSTLGELKHLAFHDPLTGLANRALFHDRSDHAVQQPATPLSPAVLYIDLDGFKQVNDRLGHAAGDALLVAVAARLHNCVRPTDTVARLGGDEFAVLLTGVDSITGINTVAERIVRVIGEEFIVNGEPVSIGASVGVARNEPDNLDARDDLLRRADLAMYAAKMQGKRRYLTFEPHMRATMIDTNAN
jgi:diguanylate cyclase